MASMDIGIDLGTSTTIANDSARRTVIQIPSLVAVNLHTDKVVAIGESVYRMVGRTNDSVEIRRPLRSGSISDYKTAEILIRHLVRQVCRNQLVKPQITLSVPSSTTPVESQAIIDAAVAAGARKVYLIEGPVAAAIGAGIDLSRPNGNMIVDIGGGITNIAVLSLNGIVLKQSLCTASEQLDLAIQRYIRSRYNLLIGEKQAEQIKIEIGSVDPDAPDASAVAKGRSLITGLPQQISVSRSELYPHLQPIIDDIVFVVHNVLEKTPPELVGDIYTNGILLTGGGSLIHGLDTIMSQRLKLPVRLAENPTECAAIGTAYSFQYLDKLVDGFVMPSTYSR